MTSGIPERFFIHMRNVNQHVQGVSVLNEGDTLSGKPRAAVRAAGKRPVNAGAKRLAMFQKGPMLRTRRYRKPVDRLLAVKTARALNMRHHRQHFILTVSVRYPPRSGTIAPGHRSGRQAA